LISSYIISLAPSVIVSICFYEALMIKSSLLTLSIFACFFLLSLKYGWRVIRIVGWQKYTQNNEINN
jgi:hypothetical protein